METHRFTRRFGGSPTARSAQNAWELAGRPPGQYADYWGSHSGMQTAPLRRRFMRGSKWIGSRECDRAGRPVTHPGGSPDFWAEGKEYHGLRIVETRTAADLANALI